MNAWQHIGAAVQHRVVRPVIRLVSRNRELAAIYGTIWLILAVLFVLLFGAGKRAVIQVLRQETMDLAYELANRIQPEDIEQINRVEDEGSAAFERVAETLRRVTRIDPLVRTAYVVRRKVGEPNAFEYVVSRIVYDRDGDGITYPYEGFVAPGQPFNARQHPELLHGADTPAGDTHITWYRPFRGSLTAFAPIRTAAGQRFSYVCVERTLPGIVGTLFSLAGTVAFRLFLTGALLTLVIHLFYTQRSVLEANKEMAEELRSRHEGMQVAHAQLLRNNEQFHRELRLARQVQLAFLPSEFPRKDRIRFERMYQSCEIIGGDLFDVFELDDQHVGLYVADVAGHGVSAALICGVLKMAVTSLRQTAEDVGPDGTSLLLAPDRLLRRLNEMLLQEIPDYTFISMIYAVLDLEGHQVTLANAGHPYPLYYHRATGSVREWTVTSGGALGVFPGTRFETVTERVQPGDRMLFYSDGLTEAMNERRQQFGLERLKETVERSGNRPVHELLEGIWRSVNLHRGGYQLSDDLTLLVAEIG